MASSLLQQGLKLARLGDYQGAIKLFNQAIAADETSAEIYYQRGRVYLKLEQPEQAIADFNQSLSLEPQQANVYVERAAAFLVLKQEQSSIIDLQAALSLVPDHPQAYKLWAKVCAKNQEFDQAINHLKQAGQIYLEQQDKESCRLCIAQMRQLEQQKISAQGGVTNQAFLQQIQRKVSQGQLGEAFRDCNWLLKLDPYDAEAYKCRGEIALELAEYEQARQDLHQAAKCFRTQGNLAESERLERRCLGLQLDSVYRQSDLPETSNRLIRTAAPQNPLQNRLYLLVGNWNIAQSLVERLMQLHPGRPETWYWEEAIREVEQD